MFPALRWPRCGLSWSLERMFSPEQSVWLGRGHAQELPVEGSVNLLVLAPVVVLQKKKKKKIGSSGEPTHPQRESLLQSCQQLPLHCLYFYAIGLRPRFHSYSHPGSSQLLPGHVLLWGLHPPSSKLVYLFIFSRTPFCGSEAKVQGANLQFSLSFLSLPPISPQRGAWEM